ADPAVGFPLAAFFADERQLEAPFLTERDGDAGLGRRGAPLLDQLAVLDDGAPGDAVVIPLGLHAQLREIARHFGEHRERDALLRREAVFERAGVVMLGV